MNSEPVIDIDTLRVQQNGLRRLGRLHWFHWVIVGLSILITFVAWQTSTAAIEERTQGRFLQESNRVVNLIRERLKHYEDALLSGVAAMQTQGGEMTRAQWRRYTEYLDLTGRYPGISGIGVIHYVEEDKLDLFVESTRQNSPGFSVHPEHSFDFHLPITFIEPEQANAPAVGLDVAFETNRRDAALRARRLGTTQISGPIVLVQDTGKTPGFLFYAPYYQRDPDASPTAINEAYRKLTFQGFVYAPLVVRTLVVGAVGRETDLVSISIRDGETVLYREPNSDGWQPALSSTQEVDLNGRTWVFEIHSTKAFSTSTGLSEPMVVLISGLTIDAMLLLLFALMSRSNRRVLCLAEIMTNSLSTQALSIAEKNRDLESFAHVVSHDLKTPIRGIQDLTGFLKEDLQPYLASNEANPEVQFCLDELDNQATRGESLISGILAYSIAGSTQGQQSSVDTRVMVEEIGASLRVKQGQLQLDGDFPVFTTHVVQLEQVLSNLIGNAFKYNPDTIKAKVLVSVSCEDHVYRFSVADNGPGIERRFHERVFQPFATLETRHDIHSSGIGLSIVKRSVQAQGGDVDVESGSEGGTTFHFTWPMVSTEPLQHKIA